MTTETLAFAEACARVVQYCPDGYAKAYANKGAELVAAGADRETLRVQALYILSNTGGWRGAEARMVKDTLIEFSKRPK